MSMSHTRPKTPLSFSLCIKPLCTKVRIGRIELNERRIARTNIKILCGKICSLLLRILHVRHLKEIFLLKPPVPARAAFTL